MKNFVKRVFALAISAAVVFSAVMPISVSAASATLLDEDFTTIESLDGWKSTNTKGNTVSEGTFKLENNALNVYTGIKDNGVDRLTKSFSPINAGDTLEVTGTLTLAEPGWWDAHNVALKLGNGTKNFSILQVYSGGGTFLGGAAVNTDEINGYAVNSQKFDINDGNGTYPYTVIKNREFSYRATLAPLSEGYRLTVKIESGESFQCNVPELSIDMTTEDATAIDRIYFSSGAFSTGTRADVFKVKTLKIKREIYEKPVLEFGDNLLYSNSGVRAEEDFSTWSSTSDIATVSDKDYERGAKWAYSNTLGNDTKETTFVAEDNMLNVYTGITGNGVDRLTKRFNPINAGDTLKITGTFKVQEMDYWAGHDVALKLGNGTHNYSLLQLYSGGFFKLGAATADTNEANGFSVNSQMFSINDGFGTDPFTIIKNREFGYCAVLEPQGEEGYMLKIKIENISGLNDISVPELSMFLTTEEATSLDRMYFSSGANTTGTKAAAIQTKNLKIEVIGAKTALENGENTVYVPMKNLNGAKANFTLVAALCENSGVKKAFKIVDFSDVTDYIKNLPVNITVEDKDSQYVKVFVFDNMENITPLTGAKTAQ